MPPMTFIGNLVARGDRRGQPAGGVRGDKAGRRAGVHPVLAAVHAAAGAAGIHGQPAGVRGCLCRARVPAAGTEEQSADPSALDRASDGGRAVRGRLAFEGLSFAYSPDKPPISGLSRAVELGQPVAIRCWCKRLWRTAVRPDAISNCPPPFHDPRCDGGRAGRRTGNARITAPPRSGLCAAVRGQVSSRCLRGTYVRSLPG